MNKSLFLLLGGYLLFIFFLLLFINIFYLEGTPHVPDDAAYLFMAKIFATGHILPLIPVSPEHFDFFPGILTVDSGKWLFQYPFGHPMLLALGVLIGIPNAIPPLIGMLVVLLLFLIAKAVYDTKIALIVSLFPLFSPFFLENAASFMSHNTSSFYLLLSLFCLISYFKNQRQSFFPLLTGFFLGLLFSTRPLTGVPFILLFSSFLLLSKNNKYKTLSVFLFSIGASIPFVWWLLYNSVTTGSPFISQYFTLNKGFFGFDQNVSLQHFVTERLDNAKIHFLNLLPMLFNLPLVPTLLLLTLPIIDKKKNTWDRLFFYALFTLPIVYFFYNGSFLMYGPRFWYEILPFIFLLTGRGIAYALSKFPKVTLLFCIFLCIWSVGRFFSVFPSTDPDPNSPLAAERLIEFNYINSGIIKTVQKAGIHNAVVLVADCKGNWWCYGSVFPQNNPSLTTDIIYAKDLGEKNKRLKAYYPTRTFYRIDYHHLVLQKLTE